MNTALIIGSGPAAAGASLALAFRNDIKLTVIDMGLRLENERQELVDRVAFSDPDQWETPLVEAISAPPVKSRVRGVPEKRLYGSDYPFRNIGQLDGVTAAHANAALVSAAYGGFSTIWGSQLMPFTDATFESWPITAAAMRPHYKAILTQIPFAAEEDDLAKDFPLVVEADPLPPLSSRSRTVLASYVRERGTLNARGIVMGKARLAFQSNSCTRCGMCMTGCPYGLIYSAAHTFDGLIDSGRIDHLSGFLVIAVGEDGGKAFVIAKEIATGQVQRFEADRVYLACGAVGTTRLVANSRRLFGEVPMLESQQFVLPFISGRLAPDPRGEDNFALNQFNMTIASGGDPLDISQLHFYSYNPAFNDALPSLVQRSSWAQSQVLRRLTVALGYLPSWRSPRISVRVRPPVQGSLPDLHVTPGLVSTGRSRMMGSVLSKLLRSGHLLDLYPVLPMARLAVAGKSYHWGGSFPHADPATTALHSDRLGRVGDWDRIHLVDASVFPSIPAMTFTLTIMANAHRIATESLALSDEAS